MKMDLGAAASRRCGAAWQGRGSKAHMICGCHATVLFRSNLHGKLPSLNLFWLSWPLSAGTERLSLLPQLHVRALIVRQPRSPSPPAPAAEVHRRHLELQQLHLPDVVSCSHSITALPRLDS